MLRVESVAGLRVSGSVIGSTISMSRRTESESYSTGLGTTLISLSSKCRGVSRRNTNEDRTRRFRRDRPTFAGNLLEASARLGRKCRPGIWERIPARAPLEVELHAVESAGSARVHGSVA